MIYNLVTWFTECPYFNFLSSFCSIGSAIAIINFLYFRKPKLKINPAETQKIIDKLLAAASQDPKIFIPMALSDFDDFPDLKGKRMEAASSFYIQLSTKTDLLFFALIQTNSDLRLYASPDILQASFRLIATNKTNSDLNKLLSFAAKINTLSDEEFLKEVLSKIEDI